MPLIVRVTGALEGEKPGPGAAESWLKHTERTGLCALLPSLPSALRKKREGESDESREMGRREEKMGRGRKMGEKEKSFREKVRGQWREQKSRRTALHHLHQG